MGIFFEFFQKRKSLQWVWHRFQRYRQLVLAGSLLLLVILLHTFLFWWFENQPPKRSIDLFTSLWLTLTTITTVGYGDVSATTVGGRLSTMILAYATGLSLFAWVGSEVISRLLERMLNRRRGMVKRAGVEGHYVLVNFPGEEKVRSLVERLRENEATALTPVVLVTDNIDMLPFDYSHVRFVRGSVTSPQTYIRADIDKAVCAIVLANDHEDPASDALTAAAISTIEALNPNVRTIAECVYEEHLTLFRHVQCDQVVLAGDMLIRLLVQESLDESAARAISLLLEPSGCEFYSARVGEYGAGSTFQQILIKLIESEVQMLPVGYRREGKVELNPPRNTKLEAEDFLIFLSDSRPPWSELPKSLFS